MELPILSSGTFGQYITQCKELLGDFFAPLDQEAFNYFYLDNQRFTMPIDQIQSILNQEYVTLKPVRITYTTNAGNDYQEMIAQVMSPLTYDNGVKLLNLASNQSIHLSAQSILKVEPSKKLLATL